MTERPASAPVAEGVGATVSEDGDYVVLSFQLAGGEVTNIAFPAMGLGHMLTHLIATGGELGERHQAALDEDAPINVLPLPASALGVGPGDDDDEAILAVRTGPITLSFSVDVPTLRETCERVLQAPGWSDESEMPH